jgi:hypothetical protein
MAITHESIELAGKEARGDDRFNAVVWSIVAALAATVVLAGAWLGFQIAWRSYFLPATACGALKIGAAFYRKHRGEMNLASTLESAAQILAFAAVAAPLSYLAASFTLPLQDDLLSRADRALGFDWEGLLGFLDRSPALFQMLRVAYGSLGVQIVAAVLLLGFAGKLPVLRTFVLAFILAALVTIAVSRGFTMPCWAKRNFCRSPTRSARFSSVCAMAVFGS